MQIHLERGNHHPNSRQLAAPLHSTRPRLGSITPAGHEDACCRFGDAYRCNDATNLVMLPISFTACSASRVSFTSRCNFTRSTCAVTQERRPCITSDPITQVTDCVALATHPSHDSTCAHIRTRVTECAVMPIGAEGQGVQASPPPPPRSGPFHFTSYRCCNSHTNRQRFTTRPAGAAHTARCCWRR